jgi:hypothetical protein
MTSNIEFDHHIGLNPIPSAVECHPNGKEYLVASGGTIVIGDLYDIHSQKFFRHHDDFITAFSVSASGKYIASGQRGLNQN